MVLCALKLSSLAPSSACLIVYIFPWIFLWRYYIIHLHVSPVFGAVVVFGFCVALLLECYDTLPVPLFTDRPIFCSFLSLIPAQV